MNFKTYIIAGFASVLLLPALAQEDTVMRFSVSEAQEYAIEHNRELQNAKEEVLLAEEQYKAARGQGLPQISGNLDYMTNFNYEAELEFGSSQDNDPPDIDYTALDPGDFEILKILESMTSSGP